MSRKQPMATGRFVRPIGGWLLALILVSSFNANAQYSTPKFDVQGHRGARGLMPENTIPAFLMALDSGVTTLELDLAVTKDKQLVVSHEPWMNHLICLDPSGNPIDSVQAMRANIYQMTYDEVKQWDCGSKGNKRFPEQQKIKVAKPLLKDVIAAVESHIKSYSRYEVDYNIEIKTDPRGDKLFHPSPEEFADIVITLLNEYLPMKRVIIQSFDFRVLKYLHEKYPDIKLAALVEDKRNPATVLKDLGFVPDVYSPDFKLLKPDQVTFLHKQNVNGQKKATMRITPWTVNQEKDMKALKKMGVDGIITDYPNRAKNL